MRALLKLANNGLNIMYTCSNLHSVLATCIHIYEPVSSPFNDKWEVEDPPSQRPLLKSGGVYATSSRQDKTDPPSDRDRERSEEDGRKGGHSGREQERRTARLLALCA